MSISDKNLKTARTKAAEVITKCGHKFPLIWKLGLHEGWRQPGCIWDRRGRHPDRRDCSTDLLDAVREVLNVAF